MANKSAISPFLGGHLFGASSVRLAKVFPESSFRFFGESPKSHVHTAREAVCICLFASWRRSFDPCTPLLFDLYHYLEQNGYFWWVPEHAPGPSSQVLPSSRVRHPPYSMRLFVRRKRAVSPKSLASLLVGFLDLWPVFFWRVAKKPCTYAKELHRQSVWQVVKSLAYLYGSLAFVQGFLASCQKAL